MKKKWIGRLVNLYFDDHIKRARILGIEFHQGLKKPVFHLRSEFGNDFRLTRSELMYYMCQERF